jgi:hypothetical protein
MPVLDHPRLAPAISFAFSRRRVELVKRLLKQSMELL